MVALYRRGMAERSFRTYVTDALGASPRWFDVEYPSRRRHDETAEEIAERVISSAGLEVLDETA